MLINGYMFTGRVGLGNHRRDDNELFIIWFVHIIGNMIKMRMSMNKLASLDSKTSTNPPTR